MEKKDKFNDEKLNDYLTPKDDTETKNIDNEIQSTQSNRVLLLIRIQIQELSQQ